MTKARREFSDAKQGVIRKHERQGRIEGDHGFVVCRVCMATFFHRGRVLYDVDETTGAWVQHEHQPPPLIEGIHIEDSPGPYREH